MLLSKLDQLEEIMIIKIVFYKLIVKIVPLKLTHGNGELPFKIQPLK